MPANQDKVVISYYNPRSETTYVIGPIDEAVSIVWYDKVVAAGMTDVFRSILNEPKSFNTGLEQAYEY